MKSWEEFKLKIHAQIEVDQHELPAFLETASELRVKGLSEQDARMVPLVQPAARNLHQSQSSDLPEISVVGGVAPGYSKLKRRGRGAKNIGNMKKEAEDVEGVEEEDFNRSESANHTSNAALRSGLLGSKQVDVKPKMSIVSRMSMIRNPKGRVRKVNKKYEEVRISEEAEWGGRAKQEGGMMGKDMQTVQVNLKRLKVKVKETRGVPRSRRSHCKKPGCGETFPNKATLEKHIEQVHTVRKTRRFHCKEPGCYETFPKKIALWLHTEETHKPAESQKCSASPGTKSATPTDSGAQVKKTRRFHCKEMGCTETFPRKTALWLHTEETHMESAASPAGTNSAMPADSGTQVKKTRRFHCKEMGCKETFPKKAVLVQHMEANHDEKAAAPVTEDDSIQKFKSAVKEALAHALPKKHSGEKSARKAGFKSPQKKGSCGGNYYPQDTLDNKSQDSSGKDKSDDIGHQGQVLMMVWAGNDGEEVENQGVAAEVEILPLPGSSVESEEFSVNPLL